MSTRILPDGTVTSCPDTLDDPPRPAVDVMARLSKSLGLPDAADEVARARLASFIPAVHGADPIAAAALDLDALYDPEAVRQSPEWWAAYGRLHNLIGGAA